MTNTTDAPATDTPRKPRYTGPITIEAMNDEPPVTRASADNSQFEALLQQSWDKRANGHQAPAIGITVPAEAASTVQNKLRQAAKAKGFGLSVETYEHDHAAVKHLALTPDKVRIRFEAKPKSNRGRKAGVPNKPKENGANTEAPASTPARAKK